MSDEGRERKQFSMREEKGKGMGRGWGKGNNLKHSSIPLVTYHNPSRYCVAMTTVNQK